MRSRWAAGPPTVGVGCWCSPDVPTRSTVREALTVPGPDSLVVAGSADPLWDSTAAPVLRGTVVEVPGADDALLTDDWPTSLAALEQTLTSVDAFLVRGRGPEG